MKARNCFLAFLFGGEIMYRILPYMDAMQALIFFNIAYAIIIAKMHLSAQTIMIQAIFCCGGGLSSFYIGCVIFNGNIILALITMGLSFRGYTWLIDRTKIIKTRMWLYCLIQVLLYFGVYCLYTANKFISG